MSEFHHAIVWIDHLSSPAAILVTGPANAKGELVSYLEAHQ